ncbi:MAG: dTDP-4-dehydrorhamnose reductase [Ectobacillus sp.]
MKKIAITGAGGQLGKQFAAQLAGGGYEVYALNRKGMDVANRKQVRAVLEKLVPDIVIHCAAYTKVDLAERNRDEAFLINAIGARNVAAAAETVKAKLVYMSTDYVFDGKKGAPYDEFDVANPINVYGASKYAGEEMVRAFHSRYFIVRTSWLYGKYGNHFVGTMLRLAREAPEIKVVHDQAGAPTYAKDLAACVARVMETDAYGVYHVSNAGTCTWYEFAREIFRLHGVKVKLVPVSTGEFGAAAPRPPLSALEQFALRLNGFSPMRPWQEALREYCMK